MGTEASICVAPVRSPPSLQLRSSSPPGHVPMTKGSNSQDGTSGTPQVATKIHEMQFLKYLDDAIRSMERLPQSNLFYMWP